MGNRAVLQFKHRNQYNNKVETLPSIYLHWNGGRASVEAFLDVAKKLNIRSDSYGVARSCIHIICGYHTRLSNTGSHFCI